MNTINWTAALGQDGMKRRRLVMEYKGKPVVKDTADHCDI